MSLERIESLEWISIELQFAPNFQWYANQNSIRFLLNTINIFWIHRSASESPKRTIQVEKNEDTSLMIDSIYLHWMCSSLSSRTHCKLWILFPFLNHKTAAHLSVNLRDAWWINSVRCASLSEWWSMSRKNIKQLGIEQREMKLYLSTMANNWRSIKQGRNREDVLSITLGLAWPGGIFVQLRKECPIKYSELKM